jgi:predicted Zn-dependent protease
MDSPEANPVYADTLVEVLLALGRQEAAIAALEDALDRWPDREILTSRKRALGAAEPDARSSRRPGDVPTP